MFKQKITGQADSTKTTFYVTIGGKKKAEVSEFHPDTPHKMYLI